MKRMHKGYDIEQWGEVGYGSIYHALNQMEKKGLIKTVSTGQEGNRPPETVYSITGAGVHHRLCRRRRKAGGSGFPG